MFQKTIQTQTPLPIVRHLAFALWGPDATFDADGNANHPDARDWTQLMLCLRKRDPATGYGRNDETTRFTVDAKPKDDGFLVTIKAQNQTICDQVGRIILQEK